MKSMKKITTLLIALVLALSLTMLLVACGDDTTDSTPDSVTSTPNSTDSSNDSTKDSTGDSKPSDTPDSTPDSNPGSTPDSNPGSTPDSTPPADDPTKQTIKVNVIDNNGKGLKDAAVQICQGETCFSQPIITGRSGSGTMQVEKGATGLKAKLLEIDGYAYNFVARDEYIYFKDGVYELTIVVNKYAVTVLDQEERAVEGAYVQVCQGETCFSTPICTDADGMAYISLVASDDEVKMKVLEVEEGDYDISDEYTYFPVGVYEENIVVQARIAYTVKVSTMMGTGVKDVKVELYDVEKNRKQKTVTTDENGIARFENMKPGAYYVKASHVNPSYVIITEGTDGKYMFGDKTSLLLDVSVLPEITYTVKVPASLAGETLTIYDENHKFVDMPNIGEDGVVTFTAPNGNYIAYFYDYDTWYSPVVFYKDGVAEAEMTAVDVIPGSSKEYPLLFVEGTYGILEANQTIWYYIPFTHNKTLVFNNYSGYSFTVNWADGSSAEVSMNGASFDVSKFGEIYQIISVTASENGGAEFFLSVTAPGTIDLPYDLNEIVGDEIDGTSTTISVEKDNYVYFQYTAVADGTLTIIPNNMYAFVQMSAVEGVVCGEYQNGVCYPVKAGDTVVFYIYGIDPDTFDSMELVDVELSFTFGEKLVDYTVNVYQDFEAVDGIEIGIYKITEEGLELVKKVTSVEGLCEFASIPYSASYVVKILNMPENYECAESEIYLEGITAATFYLAHERDGSASYPYQVDNQTGEGEISIEENTTIWYEVFVYPSYDGTIFQLIIDSDNVLVTIYSADTNEDGVVDEKDTPYGTATVADGKASFKFLENNREYKIAITTVDGGALETTYTYATQEAEPGSTADSANDIEAAYSENVSISAGQTIYYRYTGEQCKLTVSVIGEGVMLKTLTRSMGGDMLNDTVGNTFTEEDTYGSWIYFAVTATEDTTFELSVLVSDVEVVE